MYEFVRILHPRSNKYSRRKTAPLAMPTPHLSILLLSFCTILLSDIVGEMRDLGEFLGSSIEEESLQKLSEESVSYKRGSDDLSSYIENYDEVYESLSKNPCILEQLEEDEPKNFPLCGVYTGDEEEESQ